jgi:histidinol phosphatase-like PHP family hydrolase
MSISRVYRRAHLNLQKMVRIKFEPRDEEDDAVLALIGEIEESLEISSYRKADIQRGFITEGLKRLHKCESLVDLCRQRGLRRSDGRKFGEKANLKHVENQ